jgi:hypothetical protein
MYSFLIAGDNKLQEVAQEAVTLLDLFPRPQIIRVKSESSLRAKFGWLLCNPDTVLIADPALPWQTDEEKKEGVKFRPEGPPTDAFGGLRVIRMLKSDNRTWGIKTIVYTTMDLRMSDLYNTPSNIFFLQHDISPDPVPLANLIKHLLALP